MSHPQAIRYAAECIDTTDLLGQFRKAELATRPGLANECNGEEGGVVG